MSLAAQLAARRRPTPETVSSSEDARELVASYRREPVEAAPPGVAEPTPLAPAAVPTPQPGVHRAAALDLGRRLRGAPIAVIDTETTERDPLLAHVVEIAVVAMDDLGPAAEPRVIYNARVRPPVPIPEGATKVHGITDADVADCPTFAEVWPAVRAAIEGRVPAAYNAPYDAIVLREECARSGLDLGPAAWGAWLDGLVLSKGLDKFERGRKLVDVARRRGIELTAHGAAGDSMATATLLLRLVLEAVSGRKHREGVFQSPPYPTIGGWLEWQRRVALEQEQDFVDYQARSGRRDPVDCPWHVLEGLPAPTPKVAPPASGTSACRSCGKPIVWSVTKDGKRIPLDPPILVGAYDQAAAADPAAAPLVLVLQDGRTCRLVAPRSDWTGQTETGRVSHYATCPDRDAWRRT